ncbi:hypothetical protein SDJN03_08428, partial [Cucurbita argyrosperma subsp. sororia]
MGPTTTSFIEYGFSTCQSLLCFRGPTTDSSDGGRNFAPFWRTSLFFLESFRLLLCRLSSAYPVQWVCQCSIKSKASVVGFFGHLFTEDL